jgi:hypothetical protein
VTATLLPAQVSDSETSDSIRSSPSIRCQPPTCDAIMLMPSDLHKQSLKGTDGYRLVLSCDGTTAELEISRQSGCPTAGNLGKMALVSETTLPDKKLIGVTELAAIAGVDPKTVRREIARGNLAAEKTHDWVIETSDARTWLATYEKYATLKKPRKT